MCECVCVTHTHTHIHTQTQQAFEVEHKNHMTQRKKNLFLSLLSFALISGPCLYLCFSSSPRSLISSSIFSFLFTSFTSPASSFFSTHLSLFPACLCFLFTQISYSSLYFFFSLRPLSLLPLLTTAVLLKFAQLPHPSYIFPAFFFCTLAHLISNHECQPLNMT